MYCAYLVLRQYLKGQRLEKKIAAIIAIIAFLDVPLIHYSVKLWRGIHPSVVSEKNGLPTSMKQTLTLTLCCLIIFCIMLWVEKMKVLKLQDQVARKKLELSS